MRVVVGPGSWWTFIVRGAFGVLIALFVWFGPHVPLLTLVTVFGTWAIVDGLFHLAVAIARSPALRRPRSVLLLAGAIGLAATLLVLSTPRITTVGLLYVIAASMILRGIFELAAALPIRTVLKREWLVIAGSYLSVIMGFVLMSLPGAGARGVVPWLGAYALVLGVLLLAAGLKLRAV